jgi:signal transduction histidine kinase
LNETGDVGLRDILVALNAARSSQELLDYLVTRARDLLESEATVLYRFDPERGVVSIEAGAGLPAEAFAGEALPTVLPLVAADSLGASALDELVLGEKFAVYRASQLERVRLLADRTAESGGPSVPVRTWFRYLGQHYRTAISVPLDVMGETYGTLAFYYTIPYDVSDEARLLAVGFASQAALAIENAQLRGRAERAAARAAVLQERSRLARDLHDSVTQSLYSLTLLSEAARRLAASGDLDKVQEAISRLGDIGQQALKEMRLLVYQLRPSVLRREGLVRALAYRLETVEKRAGVETTLAVEGRLDLAPSVEEQVYHVVQEALNNALKHACATSVTVRLVGHEQGLTVAVEDNGVGFDIERFDGEIGIGLSSMRERVVSLGGQLILASSPGQGTRVLISLDAAGLLGASDE